MHGYCQRKVALEELTARKKFIPKKKKNSFHYCNQEEIKTKGERVLNTRGNYWQSARVY